MILIIGGAFQGKKDYVLNTFNLCENDIYYIEDTNINFNKKIIYGFHNWVLNNIKQNKIPVNEIINILPKLQDKIIIANEIGGGIVPIQKEERLFIEQNGKILQIISRNSKNVIRIYCGIGEILK